MYLWRRPEWNGYIRRDKASAGTMCHRESGFLAELAQELAMEQRQNVWVDGSLRDFEWSSRKLQEIRRRHPHYRVALIYVHASEDTVRQRVRTRAARDERDVPEVVLAASLAAPAQTLRALTPLVDFVARILNETEPVLEAFESVDTTGDWTKISEMFGGHYRFHHSSNGSDTTVTSRHSSTRRANNVRAHSGNSSTVGGAVKHTWIGASTHESVPNSEQGALKRSDSEPVIAIPPREASLASSWSSFFGRSDDDDDDSTVAVPRQQFSTVDDDEDDDDRQDASALSAPRGLLHGGTGADWMVHHEREIAILRAQREHDIATIADLRQRLSAYQQEQQRPTQYES